MPQVAEGLLELVTDSNSESQTHTSLLLDNVAKIEREFDFFFIIFFL